MKGVSSTTTICHYVAFLDQIPNNPSRKKPFRVHCFSVPSRAPNGLRLTSFEFTSDLLVEWNPLSQQYANGELLGYTIYYRDFNVVWSTNQSVNTSNPYSTQVTLAGLKHAHEYLVVVAAFTSKGEGPWSDNESAITGIRRLIVSFFNYSPDTIKVQYTFQHSKVLIKRATIYLDYMYLRNVKIDKIDR